MEPEQSGLILVVDGHSDYRTTLAGMLKEQGFRVIIAPDVATAIHQLRSAQALSLVITNDKLEDGSALNVLDYAQQQDPPIPVVVMSFVFGKRTRLPQDKWVDMGAAGTFLKTATLKEILALVRTHARKL